MVCGILSRYWRYFVFTLSVRVRFDGSRLSIILYVYAFDWWSIDRNDIMAGRGVLYR